MRIKKGDTVLVIQGKEKGKSGKVVSVDPESATLKISGINIGKKHVKSQQGRKTGGGITEIAMPMPISKVMFLCSHCNKPVRLGSHTASTGSKERICKICKSTV